MCELEWSAFKLKSFAWCIAQQEPEVDVENMPFDVNQDVLVVPVFDLKDVADKTVSAKRVCKVLNSSVVLLRAGFPVLTAEVVDDCGVWPACLLLY